MTTALYGNGEPSLYFEFPKCTEWSAHENELLIVCCAYVGENWSCYNWIVLHVTNWGRDEMIAILQSTFLNAFSRMKTF